MRIGSQDFDFAHRRYVMGILNVTPDSFSDGGLYLDPERALDHARQLEAEGADIIDVGAESTRPGAEPISAEEEWFRLKPVLNKICSRLRIPVSVDTYKASVADKALSEGAVLINDISAMEDPAMADIILRHNIPIIFMHKKGTPKTMQDKPFYQDVVGEVRDFFKIRLEKARSCGLTKLLVDPGIGFGKSLEDNIALVKSLRSLEELQTPIVFGCSRKRMIREIFGADPSQISTGTAIIETLALQQGANIIRTHEPRAISKLIAPHICLF